MGGNTKNGVRDRISDQRLLFSNCSEFSIAPVINTETSNSKSTHGELCLLMAHSELVSHSCDVLTLRVLTSLLRLQMGFRFYLLIALAVSCHGLPTTTEDVVPEVPDPH